MLELYYFPNATCGVKARLVLHEKGVDYTRRNLNRDAGDLQTPKYRALNPNGVVPTMVHDGHVLIESTVIMSYTDDAFDGPPLKPDTPLGRADMAMWMKLTDERYFPALADLTYATSQRARVRGRYQTDAEIDDYLSHVTNEAERARRRSVLMDGPASPEARRAIVVLNGMLDRIDRTVADASFLCGSRYTLADAALTPFLARLELLCMDPLWKKNYPNATRWWDRIKARPSFADEAAKDVTEEYRAFVGAEGRKCWPALRDYLETQSG
ncbi:MAG: glutathione S-transferase family protein [Bauldia litoralis]